MYQATDNDRITVGALGVRFLVEASDSNGSAAVFECYVPVNARKWGIPFAPPVQPGKVAPGSSAIAETRPRGSVRVAGDAVDSLHILTAVAASAALRA